MILKVFRTVVQTRALTELKMISISYLGWLLSHYLAAWSSVWVCFLEWSSSFPNKILRARIQSRAFHFCLLFSQSTGSLVSCLTLNNLALFFLEWSSSCATLRCCCRRPAPRWPGSSSRSGFRAAKSSEPDTPSGPSSGWGSCHWKSRLNRKRSCRCPIQTAASRSRTCLTWVSFFVYLLLKVATSLVDMSHITQCTVYNTSLTWIDVVFTNYKRKGRFLSPC